MKFGIVSLEALSQMEALTVKDITFPKSEYEELRKRTTIITHRVSTDATKFNQGDLVYAEPIDDNYCFLVEQKKDITRVEDSPFFKYLTAGQVSYLKKFDKIAVLTLKKTKYERPYKPSTIRAKYDPDVAKKVLGNPCHLWRAQTGIDMIHLEPDDAEQKRTCGNWRLLPDPYKKVSDRKSIELFGLDNLNHEQMLPVDRIKKTFSMITYGLRDPKTNQGWKLTHAPTTGDDYYKIWRLGTPKQTIESKFGNCYDTVAISLESLAKTKIKYAHFFMVNKEGAFMDTPTHTFLIYQDPVGEWRWLEGSWGSFRNNDWHTKNAQELVKWIGTAMANMEKKPVEIHALKGYPKYGCNMETFEKYCRAAPVVLVCDPEKK